ncbi:MAG TPA: DEAD/DEAH box helicase family protein [Gaiellaceae bacterium]|nr:DEAD/DEAH box helicase family protein [Gaiellaceae bacterium]
MTELVPRGYQSVALHDLAAAWRHLRARALPPRILLVSRTGTGKTVVAGMFLAGVRRRGRRAAFIVREKALIPQTSKHLTRIGIEHGVVAAGYPASPSAPAQLCSAQTLTSRGEAPEADVLVFDETETILCETSMRIVSAYPNAECILGLTATPERGDGRPLGDFYKALVQVKATFEELVGLEALVPVTVLRPGGGKPSRDLAEDPIVSLRRFAPRGQKKPVIFASSRPLALELAERAAGIGYRSARVDGETKEREREDSLARFQLPASHPDALDLLTTVKALERGWDCPPADVGILARGFSTWGTFIQACGRFLRPHPGKARALIVDLKGSVYIHGLPDEDRVFSLSESETERGKKEQLGALTTCKSCGAVFRCAELCPRCGVAAPPRPPPRVTPDDLSSETRIVPRLEKAATWVALQRLAFAKGHKIGWAIAIYKHKYGHHPHHTKEEMALARSAPRRGA